MKTHCIIIDQTFNLKLFDFRNYSREEININCPNLYDNVKNLVEKGRQVDMSSFEDIFYNNLILATIYNGSELVACGALKIPKESYKQRIFDASESEFNPNDFVFELGWMVTDDAHKRKGYCSLLVQKLLIMNKDVPIYATIRDSNTTMRGILKRNGFISSGKPYKGKGDYKIILYLKNAL